jgi:hypothetical protein
MVVGVGELDYWILFLTLPFAFLPAHKRNYNFSFIKILYSLSGVILKGWVGFALPFFLVKSFVW